MEAIRFSSKGEASVTEVAEPVLRPGHAIIAIRAAGLCHTDIEVLHGRYGAGAFPLVPGHEMAGVVEAVADDVTDLKPGDRVAVDPNLPCGKCRSCCKGLRNLCSSLGAYGVTVDGGFAARGLYRADRLHGIGALTFQTAALAEPLACVLNGLKAANLPTAVDGALVFGAGPIGLLIALALKARGVTGVVVADILQERLNFATELGLDTDRSGSSTLVRRKRQFDFVADATGVPSVVAGLLEYAADGGTCLIFGVCAPETEVSFRPFEIFRRQLKIVGSHSLNVNIPEALAVLDQEQAGSMTRLVSHRLPLHEVLPFIVDTKSGPGTMKVQYVPET